MEKIRNMVLFMLASAVVMLGTGMIMEMSGYVSYASTMYKFSALTLLSLFIFGNAVDPTEEDKKDEDDKDGK